jgi:hypothetical protein
MRKPRRWRKDFPYYKIQVFDETVKSWKDERKVFKTVEAAQDYITRKIAPRPARIIVVEHGGRHVLNT